MSHMFKRCSSKSGVCLLNTLETMCPVEDLLNRYVLVSFSPPLVGLCRVWVDADGSVAVSDGCVGFLHLDEDTNMKRTSDHQSSITKRVLIKAKRHQKPLNAILFFR